MSTSVHAGIHTPLDRHPCPLEAHPLGSAPPRKHTPLGSTSTPRSTPSQEAQPLFPTITAADGTHPTRMLSCSSFVFVKRHFWIDRVSDFHRRLYPGEGSETWSRDSWDSQGEGSVYCCHGNTWVRNAETHDSRLRQWLRSTPRSLSGAHLQEVKIPDGRGSVVPRRSSDNSDWLSQWIYFCLSMICQKIRIVLLQYKIVS